MKYVFGNWKMYLSIDGAVDLAKHLSSFKIDKSNVAVAVFPNELVAREVVETLGENIACGAQNASWVSAGAYTGATSMQLFKEMGFSYVLVGHSERRHIFGETNEDTRKKLESAIDAGLTPVLCVGETKDEKDSGKREEVIKEQLRVALEGLQNGGEVIIAYEPVWAIGTGDACEPKEAEEVHNFIKEEVKKNTQSEPSVLYGGSVDTENVLSYLEMNSVSGVLVGGASTKFDTFTEIIKKAENLE